jgi:hypothetical protein
LHYFSADSGTLPFLPMPLHSLHVSTDLVSATGTTPRPSQLPQIERYAGIGIFAIWSNEIMALPHLLAPVSCLLQATLNIQALLQGMTLDGHQAIRATLLELFASAAMELISK